MDTGALRKIFSQAVRHNAIEFAGDRLIIRWAPIQLSMETALWYAKYHIDGRPYHPGDKFYLTKTTKGTKPIDSYTFMEIVRRRVKAQVIADVKSLEVNLTI